MTVYELIKALERFPSDQPVMILDGHNGGGNPREINLGPVSRCIRERDTEETADCEDLNVGTFIVALGFGCY
jgi:hypothetical protein